MQVSVRDLMATQPATVNQHTTIAEARRIVLDGALPEVYVIDDLGRLLGTVSDYELLKATMMHADSEQPVLRVMSRSILVLRPETPFEQVAGLFRESCHARLPVVEGGQVVGQLCRRDVLRTLLLIDQMQADPAEATRNVRVELAETQTPPDTHISSASIGSPAMATVHG